jgi:glycosyltransferase involved in cell wall biosynthesis
MSNGIGLFRSNLLMRKKVIIVKNYYPIEKDTRLIKILKMLEKEGCTLTFLGWDRDTIKLSCEYNQNENNKKIIMRRIAPYGFKSLIFLPLWWFFVLKWLLKLDWDIVHVVNITSIIPAILVAKLKNKLVVYDIEDTAIDLFLTPRVIRLIVIQLEKLFIKYVNVVILVDEMQINEFGGIPNSKIVVIYDSPYDYSQPTDISVTSMKKRIFNIFYAGYLNKAGHLNIESLIEAIKDIEDVKLIIAGEGDLVEEIKIKAHEMPNKIQYIGWIPYDKVLEKSYQADLLFSLRDIFPLVHKYICGSKFLEALMCGKPILVNRGTSAAYKVLENKCGIIVDAHNINEIKEVIIKLKNDRILCNTLGMNGRKAYERKYGWEIMKQKLINLYSKLLHLKY